jgi:D-alanyl-D-alanine carboxypeptidase/D-alanyl-D-alanine-endopeptidase (penicillin-binding protein 4)
MTNSNFRKIISIVAFIAIGSSYGCKTNQIVAKKVAKEFDRSPLTNKYHVGFALYDKAKGEMIYQKDADKYFVPASNTKLFTFYAGLKVAGDSIPSIRYVERGDSLIFWGTGDPSLLHNPLNGQKAIEFLKNSNKRLFFASGRYTGSFYGRDWSWDDFNEYYQPEISELPLHGNVVTVTTNDAADLSIVPKSFEAFFSVDSSSQSKNYRVQRDFLGNKFQYPKVKPKANYSQEVPFKTSLALTMTLLSNAIQKDIEVVGLSMPSNAKTIYSSKTDDVLRQLMLPSDNFVAEQLLLTYADKLGLALNGPAVIKKIEEEYLTTLPDKVKWVDGSGLSKQNLFTPRSIIKLLDLIYEEVNNQERLFNLIPNGGKTGTLRNAYPKTDKPFVFAKTGTLGGVHNQSGYVITKKGRLLYYSFMNNNFVQPTSEIRAEMVRVMSYIHEKF